MLRSQVIASIRRRMIEQGFAEFQTPILTADSPEGARPYLRAEPAASRRVLRAAAGAAAIQAIADGRRVRPLFPDRAVLSRRGGPRRPRAGRVLPARFRDVVRDPGGRVRRDRAGTCTASSRNSATAGRSTRAALSAHRLSTTRCCATAPTSPICATRSSSPMSPSMFAGSDFRVFAALIEGDAACVGRSRLPERRRSRAFFRDQMNDGRNRRGQPGLGYIFFRQTAEGVLGRGPIANNLEPERDRQGCAELRARRRRRRSFSSPAPKARRNSSPARRATQDRRASSA